MPSISFFSVLKQVLFSIHVIGVTIFSIVIINFIFYILNYKKTEHVVKVKKRSVKTFKKKTEIHGDEKSEDESDDE